MFRNRTNGKSGTIFGFWSEGHLSNLSSTSTKMGFFSAYREKRELAGLALLLLATFCSSVPAVDYDLIEDNYIGWSDLAALTEQWLTDCSVSNCGGADFNNDNIINFADFALLAQQWLTIPEPHLIGRWKFDEGSGSIATDSSGRGHHGIITGAVWRDGEVGRSLDFYGAGRYVTINADALAPLVGGSHVTVTLWQYGDIDQPPDTTAFQATSSSGDRVIGAQIPWYGTVYWDTVNAGQWERVSKSAQTDEYKGRWNHWAFTKDAGAGTMKIYLNGSLWASTTGKYRLLSKAVSFKVGSNTNGQENYGGRIDDFRIYDTTLSEDEIESIYIHSFNKASTPCPGDGEAVWESQVVLKWEPAPVTTQHDVYIGTNFNDVNNANTTVYNPNGVYKGCWSVNSYNTASNDPWGLEPGTTYYWRIDTVRGSKEIKGDVWSFVYRPDEDFEQWGAETLQQIENDLRRPGSALYAEYATIGGGQLQTAYIWPQGIQFHALNNATRVDRDTYLNRLKDFAEELHTSYWSYKNGIWGYDSSVTGGTRFYDDNAWIVLGYMQLYELTDGNSLYLQRAKDAMKFVMSGENAEPQSGIAWDEGSVGTTVCATTPAIVGNLLLYQATGIEHYLVDAVRLYDWITNPAIGIQDAGTGLFHQGCDAELNVIWGYRGYQTAVPLRACLLFYQILGDASYLAEAQRLAKAMEKQWVNTHGAFGETGQWGGFDMVDAYVDLYNVDANSHWLDIVRRALYFLHTNCKDPNGRYPENWDTFQTGAIQDFHLLYQAPAASAYWKAASVMK